VHEESGGSVPGVSAIKSMMPNSALLHWKAKATAEYCVENIDEVRSLAARDKAGAIELVKESTNRYAKRAADRGTDVHTMCEITARAVMAGTKPSFAATKDDMGYLRNFARFFKEFEVKPVMVETTIWSQEHAYAGTFDLLCELKGYDGLYIVDYKSGKSGVYPEAGIQQTGYRWADSYIDEDGKFQDMPEVAGAFGMWLRPDGWALYPLRTDDSMWAVFRNLRSLYDAKMKLMPTVVEKPVNANPLKKQWRGNAR